MEGEEVVRYYIELGGMKSFENLSNVGVVFSSSEVKNLEAAAKALVGVTSWMDCWTCAEKP